MMPKQPYKIKTQTQVDNRQRYKTDYAESRSSYRTSASIKNKLTKGLTKYQDIKQAYQKPCDGTHFKTQQSDYAFEPRSSINKKDRNKSRSFKKFIQDQQKYSTHKQKRIKSFKTEITKTEAQQFSTKPSIDKFSRRLCMLTEYDKEDVVDRLSKKKTFVQERDDEDLFSPKILPKSKSLKRTKNITQLLNDDARRRQQKLEFIENQKSYKQMLTPQINQNTNRLVSKKIYSEFSEMIPENENKVPIVMAWTVIGELFNIELNPNNRQQEANLCVQMFNCLCNEGQQIVERSKLWEFIEIIIFKQCDHNSNFINIFEEIKNNFGHLYTRRISKPKTNRSAQNYSFMPQTLRSSQKYAQKHRQKMFEATKEFIENQNTSIRLNAEVKLEDMFLIGDHIKRASLEKKRLEKQEDEMKQCTFKPKINKSNSHKKHLPPKMKYTTGTLNQSKISSIKTVENGSIRQNQSLSQSLIFNGVSTLKSSKCFTNYDSKVQSAMKKSYYESVDIRSIKRERSLTSLSNTKQRIQVKNSDKAIMRVALARKNRQFENRMKSRGYGNQQNWTEYAQKQKKSVIRQHKKMKGYTNYKKITLR